MKIDESRVKYKGPIIIVSIILQGDIIYKSDLALFFSNG